MVEIDALKLRMRESQVCTQKIFTLVNGKQFVLLEKLFHVVCTVLLVLIASKHCIVLRTMNVL